MGFGEGSGEGGVAEKESWVYLQISLQHNRSRFYISMSIVSQI